MHDFKLFKKSKIKFPHDLIIIADNAYQGIQKIHKNSQIPKKKSKKSPLTKDNKKQNKTISSQRISVENTIRMIKRFKIVADKYRNRRKRFRLRFNLISGICNFEL